MQDIWNAIFEVAGSLFLSALVTQCALAWIFSALFFLILRSADRASFFRCWTWAWFARSIALTAVLVRFAVPVTEQIKPVALDGSLFSTGCYIVYQVAKFANAWWLLEGALLFARPGGRPLGGRGMLALLTFFAVLSVLLSSTIEDSLAVQAPFVVLTSAYAGWTLLRLPSGRASFGSYLTGATLFVQAGLWCLYLMAFAQPFRGTWPIVRTPWTVLTAHNSYFDLAVDVMVAAGLLTILLQELHRRQLASESERVRLSEELGRAERLRSLGTLVSGVAHELNNPLTAILGYSESIQGASEEHERLRAADVIRDQALRCRHIVRGLATFSGHEAEVQERIDARLLLQRVVQGFRFELAHRHLELVMDPGQEVPAVLGDRYALEQLFTNLLANALQVSPEGGRIRVRFERASELVQVSIDDEGPGIPPEAMTHLFDPFFTTKPPGLGMGMGLAVAHGIARSHGGTIRAENRARGGASFVVSLPAHAGAAAPELREQDIPSAPPSVRRPGLLRLLVIEDESMLCDMLRSIGRQQGWNVETASTGSDGLRLLAVPEPSFDVVLCDLRMAAPCGIEIHDRLARERPALLERFLFVTGDLSSEDAAAFAERCSRPILRKPFQIADLVRAVEETVSAGTRPA